MKTLLSVVVALLFVGGAGCTPPAARHSDELAARAALWGERFDAGDLDGLVALYADGARFLPPNEEMATGVDALREDLQALLDTGFTTNVETIETMAAGDLGYRLGSASLSTPDGTVVDRVKFIEIWRRIDGEWKIVADINNSDLPAAPGGSGTLTMASHGVGNPEVWLAAWLESNVRREQFARHGAPEVRVFQSPDDPATVGLLIDVTDMAAFQAFLGSDEGAQAKAEDTVIDEGLRILTEVED